MLSEIWVQILLKRFFFFFVSDILCSLLFYVFTQSPYHEKDVMQVQSLSNTVFEFSFSLRLVALPRKKSSIKSSDLQ